MRRMVLALSIYFGIAAFFAINALALLSGASVSTAVQRGLTAMAVLIAIGFVGGVLAKTGRPTGKTKDADG